MTAKTAFTGLWGRTTRNDFAGWAGFSLGLMSVATAGLFVAAVASGYVGWSLIAGFAALALFGLSAAIFGGTSRYDRRVKHSAPHML